MDSLLIAVGIVIGIPIAFIGVVAVAALLSKEEIDDHECGAVEGRWTDE